MAVLRFATFALDAESGELWRQGRPVHLAAQPFKVLALLASRPGEVVSRDELRRHVWGDDTFVDFDRSLNFCVATIRAALNDDARSPRFIETVPRRGYRFLADVHGAAAARAPSERRPRRAWLAALLLLLGQLPGATAAHTRATALPEAVAAFERGRQEAGEGPSGRRRSVHDLREATRLDPRFAEAYWALGDTYLRLAGERELPVAAALDEAHAAALRAVALEPMAETKLLAGVLRLARDRDWAGAERDLAAALRLAPRWDAGLVAYAKLLSAKGDDAGALLAIDRAETLSPSCELILYDSGAIRYRARRYEEALGKLADAEKLGPPGATPPDDWRRQIQLLRIKIRIAERDWSAARREALAILALDGYEEPARRRFAAGEPRETMRRFFARSVELMGPRAETGALAPLSMASACAALGETAPALSWLERAAAEPDPDLAYELRNPEYDALRAEPRFRALEARVHPAAPVSRGLVEAALVARSALPFTMP